MACFPAISFWCRPCRVSESSKPSYVTHPVMNSGVFGSSAHSSGFAWLVFLPSVFDVGRVSESTKLSNVTEPVRSSTQSRLPTNKDSWHWWFQWKRMTTVIIPRCRNVCNRNFVAQVPLDLLCVVAWDVNIEYNTPLIRIMSTDSSWNAFSTDHVAYGIAGLPAF